MAAFCKVTFNIWGKCKDRKVYYQKDLYCYLTKTKWALNIINLSPVIESILLMQAVSIFFHWYQTEETFHLNNAAGCWPCEWQNDAGLVTSQCFGEAVVYQLLPFIFWSLSPSQFPCLLGTWLAWTPICEPSHWIWCLVWWLLLEILSFSFQTNYD